MNKTTLIVIIVLLLIGYFAFDKFLSEDTPIHTNMEKNVDSDFAVIKPPDINTAVNDDSNSDGLYTDQVGDSNQSVTPNSVKAERQSNREQLLELHRNKKVTFVTLGDYIDKIQLQGNTSKSVNTQLERIKHNLKISKEMAELTKKLHVEINGKKEFDQNVLDQLLEIQKQLLIPTVVSISSENENAK